MDKIEFCFNKDKFPLYLSKCENSKKLIFYIPGLNGNGALVEHISDKFEGYNVASFDPRAQGENQSKPSRRYKKYLKDINIIINFLKDKLDVNEIYLIGESWGAALAILYDFKYKGINKVACWNCPYKIVNSEKVPFKIAFKRNLKMIITFLFSINTYDDAEFNEKLINNKIILRAIKVFRRKKISNKVILASWRSFKPAWKIIFNNKINNYLYIQSLEDIMLHNDLLEKISNNKNVLMYEKGHHVLLFDNESQENLFKDINNFLNS